MTSYKIFILCLVSILLFACSQGTNSSKTITEISQFTKTSFSTPTFTITPTYLYGATPRRITSTITPTKTPTITPTSTPTVPPETRMQFNCLKIEKTFLPGMERKGNLVVRDYSGYEGGHIPLLLLNLNTGVMVDIPDLVDQSLLDIAVSPNGQWMAYSKYVKDETTGYGSIWVNIVDNIGHQIGSFTRNNWSEVSRWLDNDRLLVKKDPENNTTPQIAGLTVLNPFTGEQHDLPTEYPDLWDLGTWRKWWHLTLTVFDSTLTRVVYPSMTNGLVLEDVSDNQILVRLSPFVVTSLPIWKTDGSRFVIANATKSLGLGPEPLDLELYSIDRSGQITKLTNLSEYYVRTSIENYQWSPDGSYIVFSVIGWFDKSESPSTSWAILDTETLEVMNYCLVPYNDLFTGPFWSPDSKQFVVEVADPNNKEHSLLVVVDIENNYSVQIADNVIPYGWMVSPR